MDGFTGNVVLKAIETCAAFVIELIRQEVRRDLRGLARRLAAAARVPRGPAPQRSRPRSAARRSWA